MLVLFKFVRIVFSIILYWEFIFWDERIWEMPRVCKDSDLWYFLKIYQWNKNYWDSVS